MHNQFISKIVHSDEFLPNIFQFSSNFLTHFILI